MSLSTQLVPPAPEPPAQPTIAGLPAVPAAAVSSQQDQLRATIRLLGNLLGETIIEQEGREVYETEEQFRAWAKAWRAGEADARAGIVAATEALTAQPEQVRAVLKAFTTYFQLVNLAEEQQRVRITRERRRVAQESGATIAESITYAARRLREEGLTPHEIQALLDNLLIMPVLTAHPTEAKRRTVLIKLNAIARQLDEMSRMSRLPSERDEILERIREEIVVLWQSDETRDRRPTVLDEVRGVLYFFQATLFRLVPRIYRELERTLEETWPGETFRIGPVLRYGSWVGGDRDGNPNVVVDVTEETIREQKEAVLRHYNVLTDELYNQLSSAITRVGCSQELLESIERDLRLLTPSERELLDRFRLEPYRQKLLLIFRRLRTTRAENEQPWKSTVHTPRAYADAAELMSDLKIIERSLLENRGERLAHGRLAELMRAVQVFGFHLATLDLRQHSARHGSAMAEVLERIKLSVNYAGMSEPQRVALLSREIANPRPLTARLDFSPETNETVALFRLVQRARQEAGDEVIQTYIISMTTAASNVLEVLLFARDAGLLGTIDVTPLFETIEDLTNAPQIMASLFANDVYRKHLAARGDTQQIMIGYSDSNKDGGYLRANWMLFRAQKELAAVCERFGIHLTLFHGRGGSLGRGGGPANRAILSQPPESVHGRVKLTEQGEVISARYENVDIAHRHLEQLMSAVLLTSGKRPHFAEMPRWTEVMDELSLIAFDCYRALVNGPAFMRFFQDATPIDFIDQLNIGSRPSRRKATASIYDLRAIPWVFAWTQSRIALPSWYGVGSALEAWVAQGDEAAQAERMATLRTMYTKWLFFRTVLDNTQLGLARADMPIASLYAGLADEEGQQVFAQISAEYERTARLVKQVANAGDLLEREEWLQRSIRVRNPYVDPLNYIQVELLRRFRQLPADADPETVRSLRESISLSVNGIAAGLQNTG